MEVKAVAKSVRMSPRKIRLVADAIRELSIQEALIVLSATQNRAAGPIAKTLESAIANAVTNNSLDKNNLMIKSIFIEQGQVMKRFHPSSRGRVHPYKKRSSHITVVLKEKVGKALPVVKSIKADDKKSAAGKAVNDTKVLADKNDDKGGKK